MLRAILALALLTLPALVPHAKAQQRVVAAGGDIAEIVHALGAGDRLVGVDDTATHPPDLAALPRIGYVRRIAAEGVLSLMPDLLIGTHDAGPPAVLDQLRAAGVRVDLAPASDRAGGVPAKIRFVGEALGLSAPAEALAAAVEADLAAVAARVATLPDRPRVLFILSIRDGAALVGGTDTSADEMIRLAGGVNAAAGIEGYKPMAAEAILAAAPDVVLMMTQHAESVGGVREILARPDIALTPAGRAGRIVTMEGMLLLGFGPRTPQAVADLARALHPETAARAGL